MSIITHPDWRLLALYAGAAAVLLVLLFSIPRIGQFFRGVFSLALLAFGLFVLFQQAAYEPSLARLTDRFGVDGQQIFGDEVSIRMSSDGHFWAKVLINGVERRMLVDSGATLTALSETTARLAEVDRNTSPLPVLVRTANGIVKAETGAVDRLSLGGIQAGKLKVIISPALGPVDVLGMNFLSELASWRVEGRTLILTPQRPEASTGPAQPLRSPQP